MPDPPAHNPGFMLSPEPRSDSEDEADATVVFLPQLVSRALIVGWMLLFSGRWLVVQGLAAAGLLGPEQVEQLDDVVLGRCYLLLLSVTLVTLLLRMARGRYSEQNPIGLHTDRNAQEGPGSAVAGGVEADSSDRGGKQA